MDGVVDNKDTSCIANQIGDAKNNGKGKPNSNAERSDSLSPRGERGGVRGSMSPTSTSLATSDGPGDIVGQILFVFDESGHLLGEYDELGNAIREYVWLGERPIAMLENGNVYFIHADHLNTPKVVTDADQQVVWKGDYSPFGEVEEIVETVEMNLRFPGQYYDVETALNYNYFRTYSSATGRYTQSDPIGLRGGLNRYLYVENSPVNYMDPKGTVKWTGSIHLAMAGVKVKRIPIPLGITDIVFEVESECIDGEKISASYRVKDAESQSWAHSPFLTLALGSIEIDDHKSYLSERSLEGAFEMDSFSALKGSGFIRTGSADGKFEWGGLVLGRFAFTGRSELIHSPKTKGCDCGD